ncbi:MAG: hypothetical protein K0B02_04630 [DPANN group archaeon]|nr:hypothetical protein [DPANN group archaeon]
MLTKKCATCKDYVNGECTLPVKEGLDQKEECEKRTFIQNLIWNVN